MTAILVLHGPNLNLLGTRQPDTYGTAGLNEINQALTDQARALNVTLTCYQSNSEGNLVDRIQQAGTEGVEYIILNPAAYTHTSIAMRDAFLAVSIPFIEVHLSNVDAREPFRHTSYFSDIAAGTIVGLGAQGYSLALTAAIQALDSKN